MADSSGQKPAVETRPVCLLPAVRSAEADGAIYTHLETEDLRGAVEGLPALRIVAE